MKSSNAKSHALSAAALLLLGAAVGAQPVSRPQTDSAVAASIAKQPNFTAAFAQANEAAGRPRFALYWNRALSDELVSRTEHYLTHSYTHEAQDRSVNGRQDAALGVRAVRENARQAFIAGYEQETVVPEVALEDVGRQLARETMTALTRVQL